MPRTKKSAKPSVTKSSKKSKKKEESEQEPVFEADAIVAVPSEGTSEHFMLVNHSTTERPL